MVFQIGSTLLDACVLAVLVKGDQYGYTLTQQVKNVLDVSESTLYPVLRRLQKDNCLETYDEPYQGRNRRYYRITNNGRDKFQMYQSEWIIFKSTVSSLLEDNVNG